MSEKNRSRQPEGLPVGGQFAKEAGASTGVALTANVPQPISITLATVVPLGGTGAPPWSVPPLPPELAQAQFGWSRGDEAGEVYAWLETDSGDVISCWRDSYGDRTSNLENGEKTSLDPDVEAEAQQHLWAVAGNAEFYSDTLASAVASDSDVQDKILALATGAPVAESSEDAVTVARKRGMAMLRVGTDDGADPAIVSNPEAAQTAMRDAVANLRHLCDELGVDFDEAVATGLTDYEEESR